MMSQFRIRHIEGYRANALGLGLHLFSWNEQELRVLVHKFFDEPGTGNAVNFNICSRDPFHETSPSFLL